MVVGGDRYVQQTSARQPALDGLRAVAVVLVLVFHAGLPFVRAGYLGVSVFFTLSGYLITTLLVDEHARTARIDLAAFWSRRLRRLMPASLMCLGGVAVARQLGAFGEVRSLRGDMTAATLQVLNWTKLAGAGTYGDIFGAVTSPLEHYWSLAIEEQFYWCWPIVLWGLISMARRRHRSLTALVGTLTVAMTGAAVAIAGVAGHDAAYWATPARLPELLVGATLACWLAEHRNPMPHASWLAPLGLAGVVALSCWWPSASGPAYEGWLPAFALLSAAVIVGLRSPSRTRAALSWRPLVAVGRISYGVYLFHWPVFVLLRERGWDLTSPPALAGGLGITFALAALSFHLVEMPVRAVRPTRATMPAIATACVAALVAAQVVAAPGTAIHADTQLLAAAAIAPADSVAPLVPVTTTVATAVTTATTGVPLASPTVAKPASVRAPEPDAPATVIPTVSSTTLPLTVADDVVPPRPVRVEVVGDSTALYVGQGLAAWSLLHPEAARVDVEWCQGCTFVLDADVTTFDVPDVLGDSRDTVERRMPAAIERLHPDVVVLMVTMMDVADREWSPDEGPLSPHDPRYVERLRGAYTDLTTRALSEGVPNVVWIVPPRPNHLWLEPAMNEADRYPIQHQAIRDVAAGFDARVSVVDLDAWLTRAGHDDDPWWRNDGVHLNDQSATALAELYLGPVLVRRALGI